MIKLPLLLLAVLCVSCMNDNTNYVANKVGSLTEDSVVTLKDSLLMHSIHDDEINQDTSLKSSVDLKAYLIYDDGTLSDFNLINNDSVMLWNAIAGGGDVLRPSRSTKFIVTGEVDNLEVKIKNGRRVAFEKKLKGPERKFEFIVKGTGCEEVFVNMARNKILILNDTIPFHCGE